MHLKSESGRWTGTGFTKDGVTRPCIDAGDPAEDVGNDPSPNGELINMGRYGGTIITIL